jgi:hypothetical protein
MKKIAPMVYLQAPEDMSDAELRANGKTILYVLERAILKDSGRIAESYPLTVRRDGDQMKVTVHGSGKILATIDDVSELNIAGWFNMDAAL